MKWMNIIALILVHLITVYLGFVFILWQPDPSIWTAQDRRMMVGFQMLLAPVSIFFFATASDIVSRGKRGD